ncbi:unnamed protein product, partial [Heterosigma akashiwo]
MEQRLFALLKERRKEGRKCSSAYLKKMARVLMKEIDPSNTSFKASEGWFRKFVVRFNLSKRRKTNVKKESAEQRRPKIEAWHKKFRMFLKSPTPEGKTRAPAEEYAKWGRFQPHLRWNVDQVPLPFVTEMDSTYEEKGADRVWIRMNGGPAAKKRFATLQLCFRIKSYEGRHYRQMKPTIIFRGTGKRIKGAEKAAYDPRVSVAFQRKAWADREFTNKWAREELLPFIEEECDGAESMLICDNLDAQTTDSFLNILRSKDISRNLVPPETTENTQPVDGGLGQHSKVLISQEMDRHLDVPEHLEQWENGTFSASEKRVLITRWVGAAWEKIFAEDGPYKPNRYFEKTGCLLTADGSEDHKIQLEGIKDY